MKKSKNELSIANRTNYILELLSKEHPNVRKEIANTFPSYNSLLNLHAISFEEFALLPLARQKGVNYKDVLFDFHSIIPLCPICHKDTDVKRRGENVYWCKVCNTKFKPNHDSMSSGFKQNAIVWRKILHCMLEFYSLKRTCEYCDITATTFYNIRNRIFYAMKLMMDEVKLYGNIQCDNTMVHLSFKGSKLQTEEYPKYSPFVNKEVSPRKARKRGGPHKMSERAENQVCVFAAIDNYGHVMIRMVGVGVSSSQKLLNIIDPHKFLFAVPETDPFYLTYKQDAQAHEEAGSPSLLIADGEGAIRKYAEKTGINFESHVYRKNGKQLRLGKNAHDIQKVNSLHSRFQNYLQKLNFVSSKYLPGFLTMFEFIENTGASEEAIGRLFEILAQPGLDENPEFFKKLFATPKYTPIELKKKEEIKKDKKVQKIETVCGLTRNQVVGVCLYDSFVKQNVDTLSLPYISKITGYPKDEIKHLYEKLKESGELDTLYKQSEGSFRTHIIDLKTIRYISTDILTYFDDYAAMRRRPFSEQLNFEQFVLYENQKYNKAYKKKSVWYYFSLIVAFGLREALPPKPKKASVTEVKFESQEKYLYFYNETQKRYAERKKTGEKVTYLQIYKELGQEHGKTAQAIETMARYGKRLQEKRA